MKPQKVARIALSLCLFLAAGALPLRSEILERVIAKVNGEAITLTDFQARQLAALRDARVPPDEQQTYLQANNRRLLDEAIDDLLIAQRAEEVGGRVPVEYLKRYLEEIKKEYGIQTEEQFEQELRREGTTVEEIMRNVERSTLTRRYIADEVEKKAVVSDAELRAEYEARKGTEYTSPETDQLQEILISDKQPNPKARAAEALARFRAGEDFAALARTFSDAPSRDAGGEIGKVARRDMHADLAAAVATLQPGQACEPISGRGGLRIVRLVAHDAGSVKPFDEVKDDLRKRMVQRRTEQRLTELAAKLREHATIQDMVREVPLQVSPETPGRPSLMDAATAAGTEPAAATEAKDEFVTTKGEVTKGAPPATEGDPPKP